MTSSLHHHAYQIARLVESGLLSAREYSLLRFLVLRGVPVCDGVSVSELLRFEGPSAGPSALAAHCRAFSEREALRRFSAVFEHISDGDVKLASRHERNELGVLGDSSLTYGEIIFSTFVSTMRQVMELWKQRDNVIVRANPVFVDLGSGAGRAVVAAALLFDFSSCIGIELLEGLHSISEEAVRRLVRLNREEESTVASNLSIDEQSPLKPPAPLPTLEMFRSSFFISPPPDLKFEDDVTGTESTFRESDKCMFDWAANGDVIFANSTCFTTRTLAALALEVPRMKNGTILVTFTRRIDHPDIRLVSTEKHDQSWGSATVYICQVQHRQNDQIVSSSLDPATSSNATIPVMSVTSPPTLSSPPPPPPLQAPPLFIRSPEADKSELVIDAGNSTPIPPQSSEKSIQSTSNSVSIAKNKGTTISATLRISPSFARVSPPNHNGYDDDSRNLESRVSSIKHHILAVHKGGFLSDNFDIWKLNAQPHIESVSGSESLYARFRASPSPSPSSPHGQALRFLKASRATVHKEETKEGVEGFRPLSDRKSALVISTDLVDEESTEDDSQSATNEFGDQSTEVGDGNAGFKCEGTSLFRKRALSAESAVGEASADLTQILQGFAVSQNKNEDASGSDKDHVCVDDTTDSDELISSIMAGTPAAAQSSQRLFQPLSSSSSSSGNDLRKFVLTRNTATPPRMSSVGVGDIASGSSSPFGSALLRERRNSPQGTALRKAKYSVKHSEG